VGAGRLILAAVALALAGVGGDLSPLLFVGLAAAAAVIQTALEGFVGAAVTVGTD
jgi:hypothetical protein